MAGVPINFAIPAENAIASYSWTDLASGQGYVRFYPFYDGSNWVMNDNKIYTGSDAFAVTNNSTSVVTFTTSTFNTPRTIKGVAYLEVSNNKTAAGPYAKSWSLAAVLKKVSGGVTSTIGTFSNYSASFHTNGASIFYMDVMKATIAQTGLKIGDYLQLEITVSSSTGGQFITYADPYLTTTGQKGPTSLALPFKIEL